MAKRLFDIVVSFAGLVAFAPLLIAAGLFVFLEDRQNPLYVAPRVGKRGIPFRMIKFRSMVVNADINAVDTTARGDPRVTRTGTFLRRLKLDELPQLISVFRGDMSFVGPRPNVEREVRLYTEAERELLDVRPGITDISSIVFSDLGEIVANSQDANIAYNQLVRPWKSRLGILYIRNQSMSLDVKLILLTFLSAVSRTKALEQLQQLARRYTSDQQLLNVIGRTTPLTPTPPLGMNSIVTSRESNVATESNLRCISNGGGAK